MTKFEKFMFIVVVIGLIFVAGYPAFAQTSLTAEKAQIFLYQEDYGVNYNNAAGTVAFTLSYDGTGTTCTACISSAGDSMEVWVDSVTQTDFDYPAAGNIGFNITAYFDAGNTMEDLVAYFDALPDFSCAIGTHMPPWIDDETKIAATASTTVASTATNFLAAYMISTKVDPASNQCVISHGHKSYQTFGAGNTCTFDIYEYTPGEDEVRMYRYPCTTATAQEKKNDEFRVDATRGYDVYYMLDFSCAANAVDYLFTNYSLLRR